MRTALLLERFAAVFALLGCTGQGLPTGVAHAGVPVSFKLTATAYVAGEIGQATLIPENGATRIALNSSGVPRNTTQPVHVYTYLYEGRCSELTTKPAHSLNKRVLVSTPSGRTGDGVRGPFQLSHAVPLRIDELLSGRFALGLRTAPADGDHLIYCGELRTS